MARIRAKNTPTFRIGNIPSNEHPTTGHNILEVFTTFRKINTFGEDGNKKQEHNGAYVCNGATFRREEFVGVDNPYDLLEADESIHVPFDEYDKILKAYGFCDKFGLDTETQQFRIPTIPTITQTINNPFDDAKGDDIFFRRGTDTQTDRVITLDMTFMVQLSAQYEEMSLANISSTINELAKQAFDTISSARDDIISNLEMTGRTYLDTIAFYQDSLSDNSKTILDDFDDKTQKYSNHLLSVLNSLDSSYAYDSLITRPVIVHIDPVGESEIEDDTPISHTTTFYRKLKDPDTTTADKLYNKQYIIDMSGTIHPVVEGTVTVNGVVYKVDGNKVTVGDRTYNIYTITNTTGSEITQDYLRDVFSKKYVPDTVLEYTYTRRADGTYSVSLYPLPNRIYFIHCPLSNLELRNVPRSYLETLIYYQSSSVGISFSIDESVEVINDKMQDRNLKDTKYLMSILNGRLAIGTRKELQLAEGNRRFYVTDADNNVVVIDTKTYDIDKNKITVGGVEYTVHPASEETPLPYVDIPIDVLPKDKEYTTDEDNLYLLTQASKNEFANLEEIKTTLLRGYNSLTNSDYNGRVDMLEQITGKVIPLDKETTDNSLQFDRDENINAWKQLSKATILSDSNTANIFEAYYSYAEDASSCRDAIENWYLYNYNHRGYLSKKYKDVIWNSSDTTPLQVQEQMKTEEPPIIEDIYHPKNKKK